MRKWVVAAVCAAMVFLAGDFGWITTMSPRLYQPALGAILAHKPDLVATAAFYALYLVGVMVFGVAPGVRAGTSTRSLASGVLLGLVAYGTYDLTNQATLKVWTVNVTLIDMGWGAAITGLASACGCAVALWAGRR